MARSVKGIVAHFTPRSEPRISPDGVEIEGYITFGDLARWALDRQRLAGYTPRATEFNAARKANWVAVYSDILKYLSSYRGGLFCISEFETRSGKPRDHDEWLIHMTNERYDGFGDGNHNRGLQTMWIILQAQRLRFEALVRGGALNLEEPDPMELFRSCKDYEDIFDLAEALQPEIESMVGELDQMQVRCSFYVPVPNSGHAGMTKWRERVPELIAEWNATKPVDATDTLFGQGKLSLFLNSLRPAVRERLDLQENENEDHVFDIAHAARCLAYLGYRAKESLPDKGKDLGVPSPAGVNNAKRGSLDFVAKLCTHESLTKQLVNGKGISYVPKNELLTSMLADPLDTLLEDQDWCELEFPAMYARATDSKTRRIFGKVAKVKETPKAKGNGKGKPKNDLKVADLAPQYKTTFGQQVKPYAYPVSYILPLVYAFSKARELKGGKMLVNEVKRQRIKELMPEFIKKHYVDVMDEARGKLIHRAVNAGSVFNTIDTFFDAKI